MTRIVPAVGFCLALLCLGSNTHAQAVYGSIAGTVVDPSGGALPGVTVSITSVDRKTVDSRGHERGRPVREGSAAARSLRSEGRALRLQAGGLSRHQGRRRLADTPRREAAGRRGQRSDHRDRLLAAPQDRSRRRVARRSTPSSSPICRSSIATSPSSSCSRRERSSSGWQHAASENPQGSTQTMVNGQHFSGTGYQLDGTENRDPILGIIVVNPTLESIAETKITSQNYDAEFGQATAGVVSVQTKSGGNQLRGSAFWFHQDESLQARSPFTQFQRDPLTGKFLPDTSKDQFGGSAGGKIVANKWFFFGDYEGSRNTIGGSRLVTVPTAAARAGDFSAYGGQHLRSRHRRAGRAAAVREQRHSRRAAVAAGARAAPAHSDAQCHGPRERDDRQLRRLRARRRSTPTHSTSASTAVFATASTRSAATASASSGATARRSSVSRVAAMSSSTLAASPMRATRASPTASTGPSRRRCSPTSDSGGSITRSTSCRTTSEPRPRQTRESPG